MTFLFALTLQCFFPLFDSNGVTGLAIVNNDAQQREYAISVASSEGTAVRTGNISLAAGNQQALLLQELAGTAPLPSPGSVRIESESSSCVNYLTNMSPEKLSATEAAASPSTSVLLPHVEVNTGFMELNYADTTVAIVNPGAVTANVTARLFGLDGAARGSTQLTLSPRGAKTVTVSEAFASFIPGNGAGGRTFQGYVRLTSDVGIVAWQRIDTPLSQSLLRGKGANEIRSTTVAMIPHFAFGGQSNYNSSINLINPTDAPIRLELSALDDRGNIMGETAKISLAAGEVKRAFVGELFRVPVIAIFPPPLITGYIRIREQQRGTFQVAGNVEIFTNPLGARASSMLYVISDVSANRWILPFAASTGGYFTGYSIANPNELLTVQTDVTVEIVSPSGAVLSKNEISLSPSTKRALTIPDGLVGYVRLTSNLPIQVLGAIGARDGSTLDQVPALP
jgi:hypothetical protein